MVTMSTLFVFDSELMRPSICGLTSTGVMWLGIICKVNFAGIKGLQGAYKRRLLRRYRCRFETWKRCGCNGLFVGGGYRNRTRPV